jgi:hypothetical protein
MMRAFVAGTMVVLASSQGVAPAVADPLSIYELQFNTTDGDASMYDGQVVDTLGGVCVAKFPGYRPRLILQDPSQPDEWGAIQVKDWIFNSGTEEFELYDHVELGDWVELTSVFVEEYRGTTFLQYQSTYSPDFRVVSHGHSLPEPMIVPVDEIPAPVWDPWDYAWHVMNHEAEPYESMSLVVRNVTVMEVGLGKAVDNYRLETPNGDACWAADYMNADVDPWGYHPYVSRGQHFCAVAGTFEQYTKVSDGWDYYQLITMKTADVVICGDGDNDGDVDRVDLPRYHTCLTGPECNGLKDGCLPPLWHIAPMGRPVMDCMMMDMDFDGDVDLADFGGLQRVFQPE